MKRGLVAVLAVALCAAAGCSKSKGEEGKAGGAARRGLGSAISPGQATDLRMTPDGSAVAFLVDAQKPRLEGVPPLMVVGRLKAARLDGSGSDRDLGDGVTNIPGGYNFSRDSRWIAFLAKYNAASQVGALHVADLRDGAGKAPVAVAEGVSDAWFSPDSKWLAFIQGGVLRVGPVAEGGPGPYAEVAGEVAVADFSPASDLLLVRRKIAAGGALLKVEVGRWQAGQKLAERVGEVRMSADSKHLAVGVGTGVPGEYDLHAGSAPKFELSKVASKVGYFEFSPDAKYLAYFQGQPAPNQPGDLFVGLADGTGARLLAPQAHSFDFSPESRSIAYLTAWRENQTGTLGVASLPDGKPKTLGVLVQKFNWSPDGTAIAFHQRFLRPIPSVDLMLYRLGEAEPVKVQQWVYEYDFTSDGKRLLYRTACVRNGRACDLYALELSAPLTANDAGVLEAKGKSLVSGVFSHFRPAERGDRVLVTFARVDSSLYDVGVVNLGNGQYKTVDERILLAPLLANAEGTKVVYAVGERARPGVYLAEQVP